MLLYGAFVWARGALNHLKRRFLAPGSGSRGGRRGRRWRPRSARSTRSRAAPAAGEPGHSDAPHCTVPPTMALQNFGVGWAISSNRPRLFRTIPRTIYSDYTAYYIQRTLYTAYSEGASQWQARLRPGDPTDPPWAQQVHDASMVGLPEVRKTPSWPRSWANFRPF